MAQPSQPDRQLKPSWLEALNFARSTLAVDIRQLLSNQWRRSTTWMWLIIAAEALVVAALVTLLSNTAAGAAAGATLLLAAITVIVVGEAHRYRNAIWRCYHRSPTGERWGAYITHRHNRPALICSVHTHPTGAGHGTHLMEALTTWADQHHTPLALKATCPAAVRFYRRHGFTPTSAGTFGRTTMTRPTSTN